MMTTPLRALVIRIVIEVIKYDSLLKLRVDLHVELYGGNFIIECACYLAGRQAYNIPDSAPVLVSPFNDESAGDLVEQLLVQIGLIVHCSKLLLWFF